MPLVTETLTLVDNGDRTFTLTVGSQARTLTHSQFADIVNGAWGWELIIAQIFINLLTAGVNLNNKAAVLTAVNGMSVKVKE